LPCIRDKTAVVKNDLLIVCPIEKELISYDQQCLLLVHLVESLATPAASACNNKEFQGGAVSVDIAFYFRVYK
jgi:hypothetical protein